VTVDNTNGSTMTRMREKIAPWTAFALCAALSTITLVTLTRPGATGWEPTFYFFLPMCFFYVGVVMAGMTKEIRELRQRIAKLEQANQAES